MHKLDETTFFDKVYACWMGKNIGGTLGGPLEGRMELLDIKGYTQQFTGPVENDDLDLQLVNLHCVEQYAGRADVSLLSREWLEHVHFQYDEYGHALTNMRRGFGTPLSGCNNNFFVDCMGSPIRSEIWAVLCAGMPDLAAYYAYHDASVDHAGGEGLSGEIFFAILESMAFVETDKKTLINKALSYLPTHSDVYKAVSELLSLHALGMPWQQARENLIAQFGGENFTYAPLNVAFTLVGWLYEEGFTQQMLTTINCGYDTDCTVATLGSLLGILYGTRYIDSVWTEPIGENIITSKPITGFAAPKTITELTERSIAARRLVQEHYAQMADKTAYAIPYQSHVEVYKLPIAAIKEHDISLEITRTVAFAPAEQSSMTVTVKNLQPIAQTLSFIPQIPGFVFAPESQSATFAPGAEKAFAFSATAPAQKEPLWQGSLTICRVIDGIWWNCETLPLNAMPTMDWRWTAGAETGLLYCRENKIDLPAAGKVVLETLLTLSESTPATLKLCTADPVQAWINGELSISCSERTAVIPAYHRADPRKCCELGSGTQFRIRIEVDAQKAHTPLYCMVVSPKCHWAYRIDSTFSAT